MTIILINLLTKEPIYLLGGEFLSL